jgi:hypothetical protein
MTQELYDFLAPPERADELGRLGPYRVLRVLGAGGMGVVFEAEALDGQQRVALKALRPALAASPSAQRRFMLEGEAGAALQHEHVVPIYQVGADRGIPFLAMPLLEGESLEDRLQREAPLPATDVLRVGREIAEALAAAQANGVIHRDVKPSNVWLEAPSGHVRILDFGLARAVGGDAHLTQSGVVVGTPAYMAPEQARGEAVDPRSDLFSLGCVLYRACTGRLPFVGNNALATLLALAQDHPPPPAKLNPRLPPGLSALIMKLLAKRPGDRYGSAREVVAALDDVAAGRAAPRGNHWHLSLILLVPLTLAGAALLVYRPQPDPPPAREPEPSIDAVFATAVTYPAGLYPRPIALGDFNRDGKPDIIVGNSQTHTVSVLLGKGDGSFAAPVTSPAQGWGSAGLAVGDFNGDGILDVVVTNGVVSVLLGRGDGTFRPPLRHEVDRNPEAVVAADFDRDGKLDIATANEGSVSILRGKGDGTFHPAVNLAVAGRCRGLVVADFNRDGWLDLATGSMLDVQLLLSTGDGNFAPAVRLPVGSGIELVASGDFDGDGVLDLAAIGSAVSILPGRGDGTFGAAVTHPQDRAAAPGLIVADLDGDGRLDVAYSCAPTPTGSSIRVLRGNGDGSFQPGRDLAVRRLTWGLAVGDVNGDGTLDLVVADRDANEVAVFLHRPPPPYQADLGQPEHYAAGREPRAVAVGDFDGDGRPDVAVADHAGDLVQVLCGDGSGLRSTNSCPTGAGPTALALGDLDGDGKPDLAVADARGNTMSVLLGQGDGSFRKASSWAVDRKPVCVALGDLDGDGRLDAVTANDDGDSVSILLARGPGQFHPARHIRLDDRPRWLALGDLNGDGKLDIAVAHFQQAGKVAILLGQGDGTFAPPVKYDVGASPLALVVADFNRDGRPDLAIANYGSADLNVLLGTSAGTFGPLVNYPTGDALATALAAADVDGDGALDLVYTNGPLHSVGWLRGRVDGSFEPPRRLVNVGLHPAALTVAQFRPGARPEIVTANAYSGSVSLLRNRPAAPYLKVGLEPVRIEADGITSTITVRANQVGVTEDRTDTDYAGTIAFQCSDPQAELPAPYTFQSGEGGHRFQARFRTRGSHMLIVSDTAGTRQPSSVPLAVFGPEEIKLQLDRPKYVSAGAPFGVTVHIFDPFRFWTKGYHGTLQFRSSDPTAKLPADYRCNGIDEAPSFPSGCVLSTPGFWSITARDAAVPGVSATANITVWPARRP